MSESDYLEMKKRKRTVLLRDRTSGNRTENIQYLNIQTIPKVNEDNEVGKKNENNNDNLNSSQSEPNKSLKKIKIE